jgi:hypothetical protein
VVSAPEGTTADHAALEFSPDVQRLFSSAGSDARLWDLTSGAVQKWSLPGGTRDSAAFDAGGQHLLLYRTESDTRGQVGRMRDLLGQDPEKPIWEYHCFDNKPLDTAISRDATLVAVHQRRRGADHEEACKLFRAATGEEIWSLSTRNTRDSANVRFDPLGKLMAIDTGSGAPCDLLELPAYRSIGRMGTFPHCLSPGAAYGGRHGDAGGFALYRRADEAPIVTMGINVQATSMHMQFSVDGKLAAWGNADGSVYVASVDEVRKQLANCGLDWQDSIDQR